MIQITRKATIGAPVILTTLGVAACKQMEAAFDAGNYVFEFDKAIYGHDTVKQALIDIQNYKCCFCEAKIGHIDDGDVEHFRPKKASQQSVGTPYIRPGYYWLAYQWSNLFLACTACNQRNKRNLFPLLVPADRAKSHKDDLAKEQPVFIHPENDNPEDYISFQHENVFAIGANDRGVKTIELLKLDRSVLTQHRAEALETLSFLHLIVHGFGSKLSPKEQAEMHSLYKELRDKKIAETSEYAGMFRAFFKRYPLP